MNTHIFNGKVLALEKESQLIDEVKRLNKSPKLVSLLIGNDKSSELFLSLKKKAAQRVGIELEIVDLSGDIEKEKIIKVISKLNKDNKVDGIMVQLPLPSTFSTEDRDEIIDAIVKKKDVDGMRKDSPFLAPVIKAVVFALKEASVYITKKEEPIVLVVGSKGFVGKKLTKILKNLGYEVEGIDVDYKNLKAKIKQADILISATGQKGLVDISKIKMGVVIIDIGAPYGDIRRSAYKKATFVSPVPGGIGPLTVYFLLENTLYTFI